MRAHWLVLAAAALTTLVAATVAAAFAVFAGQALPQVVHHDLNEARGTSLTVTALVNDPSQAAAEGAALRSRIAQAMPGIPFGYYAAAWSDPLGLVPGARPASPSGAGKGDTPLLQAAAMNAVASHATLAAGRWPPTGAVSQRQAIPAALPAAAAALLHVSAGDVLRLRDRITGATVSFDITGTFTPRPADPYWRVSYIPARGMSAGDGSVTYGPLVVSQAALGPALPVLTGSWVAQPDLTAFTEGDLGPVSAQLAALTQALPNVASLHGAQLVTSLSTVLAGAASNLTVARSTLVISALELLVLAVAALLGVARLLTEQRETETALLTARGATWAQLARLAAAEVIPLAALAAVAGGLAGGRLAALLASAGPVGAAGVRLAGAPGALPDALGAAAVVAVIAAVSLLIPVFASSPTDARASRGRQGRVAAVARAGVDLALLALAVLAGWQLRSYSAASPNGIAGIDPVLAVAPALTIAAGSVVTLRLLPLAARGADRLAARARRLTVPLAAWQFSRMPVRQGSAALLLTMAAATGTLALAQHASWARSVSDQAAFTNGGQVEVVPPAPLPPGGAGAVTAARGVTHAMAVTVDPQANPGAMVGLDAAQAAQVTQVRGDQSPLPLARLFQAITPSGGLPGAVLAAPAAGARPGAISFTVTLSSPLGPAPLGPVPVTLTVMDRTGAAYQVAAGSVVADGRAHPLTASLGGGQALYPLRVIAITTSFLMPQASAMAPAVLTVSGLPLAGWKENISNDLPDLMPEQAVNLQPPVAGAVSATGQEATFRFIEGNTIAGNPAYGQLVLLPPAPRAALPVIATKAFMDGNDLAVGDATTITMNGPQVPVRIVAEVPSFPTVTTAGGAVIADLASLQESLAGQFMSPSPVSQWWLATDGGGVPPALAAALPAGTDVTGVAQRGAAAGTDSLSAAPQLALLALAAATALLAVTGFWVSIAADVRRRRGETALLAALGVTQRGTAAALCLEKLLAGLPAAGLGFLLGVLLARLLVPAVTLSPAAQQPVPPPLIVYDLPQAIPLALAVAALPALTAALAALQRPDPAAELRAAEAG